MSEFLLVLDRHREPILREVCRSSRRISDADLYESWSGVLLWCWSRNFCGEGITDDDALRSWLRAFVRRGLRYAWLKEGQRRRHVEGTRSFAEQLISELEDEHMEQTLEVADRTPEVQQLGPSRDWFSQALADLSPRSREMLELAYVGDWSQVDIAELFGMHKDTVKKQIRAARTSIRAARERIAS